MNKLKINARPTDDNTYNVLKLNKSTKFVMAGRIEGKRGRLKGVHKELSIEHRS